LKGKLKDSSDSQSQQGNEWPDEGIRTGLLTNPSRVVPPVHIEGGIFQPSDFLSAEALGTDMPRRCKNCLKCKECQFQADSLTFKENQEYQVILDGLKFAAKRKKWTATYPFCIPPSELMDNHDQVYRYTLYQEKRLAKEGRTEEFNKQRAAEACRGDPARSRGRAVARGDERRSRRRARPCCGNQEGSRETKDRSETRREPSGHPACKRPRGKRAPTSASRYPRRRKHARREEEEHRGVATAANKSQPEVATAEELRPGKTHMVRSCNTTADQSGECVAFG
jgi:hypothetical protein